MSEFPRAYLRISPNLDQHPDPLAMLKAICAANRQPERGRFREAVVLERAVGRKSYRLLVERGDVVPANPGPGVYLDGWDQWQEGDYTVADRMRRLRAKKAQQKRDRQATPPASSDRNGVTTTALDNSYVGTAQAKGVDEPLPRQAGRRKDGTNPRAVGSNPRAQGTSPRQERAAEKRAPVSVGSLLSEGIRQDSNGSYVAFRPAPKPSKAKR